MAREEWIAAGRKLGILGRGSQWWLGDWLRFGNSRWGERYKEAARITGYDVGSLRNMAWIAGQFGPDLRDPKLSWSHYPVLAKLQPSDRPVWIERALRDRLTVADLRLELRGTQARSMRRASSKVEEVVEGAADGDDSGIKCPHCGEWIAEEGSA